MSGENEDASPPVNEEKNESNEELEHCECAYCGLDVPSKLIRCCGCNRWFCNASRGAKTSHAVEHFVRSRHNTVQLHSSLGSPPIECYRCGSRNIFQLGFIPSAGAQALVILLCRSPCLLNKSLASKDWDLAKWLPLIHEQRVQEWLLDVPTNEELKSTITCSRRQIRRLEELWAAGMKNATMANSDEMTQNLDAQAGEDDPNAQRTHLQDAELFYEDGTHYQQIMEPFVRREAMNDYSRRCQQKAIGVRIKWVEDVDKELCAVFSLHGTTVDVDEFGSTGKPKEPRRSVGSCVDWKVVPGDELELRHEGDYLHKAWKCTGIVQRVTFSDEVYVKLTYDDFGEKKGGRGKKGRKKKTIAAQFHSQAQDMQAKLKEYQRRGDGGDSESKDSQTPSEPQVTYHTGPPDTTVVNDYVVSYVWKSTTFDRMRESLTLFAEHSPRTVSNWLYNALLGADVRGIPSGLQFIEVKSEKLSVPGLASLNVSQEMAVRYCLNSALALIQGPPGTGKTVTSAAIVYFISQHTKNQILVCAPSNVAVDHLADKIHATGKRVVRLCARGRESMNSSVEFLTLHHLVKELAEKTNSPLHKLEQRRVENHGQLKSKDFRRYLQLKRKAENVLLKHAEVICCTCSGAADMRLRGMRFAHVLVDEATQATEPEAMIPVMKGAQQLILVGDHQQLGPVVTDTESALAGFGRSLFERFIMMDVRPICLTVQYRMHPALAAFPSETFYDGILQNGTTATSRTLPALRDFPWPNREVPMMFWCQRGLDELGPTGTSYLNRLEAESIATVCGELLDRGFTGMQIGVVTPYQAQRTYIHNRLSHEVALEKKNQLDMVEVSSVDAFQGREKDIIIFSCVRSNRRGQVGFLADQRRLNVALTRAKYGLIVVGNPVALQEKPLWNSFLRHCSRLGLMVEGDFGYFTRSLLRIKTLRGRGHRRNHQPEGKDRGDDKERESDFFNKEQFLAAYEKLHAKHTKRSNSDDNEDVNNKQSATSTTSVPSTAQNNGSSSAGFYDQPNANTPYSLFLGGSNLLDGSDANDAGASQSTSQDAPPPTQQSNDTDVFGNDNQNNSQSQHPNRREIAYLNQLYEDNETSAPSAGFGWGNGGGGSGSGGVSGGGDGGAGGGGGGVFFYPNPYGMYPQNHHANLNTNSSQTQQPSNAQDHSAQNASTGLQFPGAGWGGSDI